MSRTQLLWQNTHAELFSVSWPQVHDGFYEALFGTAQHKRSLRGATSTSADTVFDAACEAVTKDTIHPQVAVEHNLKAATGALFCTHPAVSVMCRRCQGD